MCIRDRYCEGHDHDDEERSEEVGQTDLGPHDYDAAGIGTGTLRPDDHDPPQLGTPQFNPADTDPSDLNQAHQRGYHDHHQDDDDHKDEARDAPKGPHVFAGEDRLDHYRADHVHRIADCIADYDWISHVDAARRHDAAGYDDLIDPAAAL